MFAYAPSVGRENGAVGGSTFVYGMGGHTRFRPLVLRGETVVVSNGLTTWATGSLIGGPEVRTFLLDGGMRALLTDWRYPPAPKSLPSLTHDVRCSGLTWLLSPARRVEATSEGTGLDGTMPTTPRAC